MHFPTLLLTTLTAALTTATPNPSPVASKLHKRCSPQYDPDLALGYLPPAPCWQTFNTACKPFLASGTEMTLDAEHHLAVVYGVPDYCAEQIAEELRREEAGQKNNGWVEKHGWLTVIEPRAEGEQRVLVISGMGEEAVERYGKLTYLEFPTGN